METKCHSFGIERVKKHLNMHGLAVDSIGKGGGLALLWDKEVFVDLVSFSRYHMDARVQLREGEDYWRFTGIYGEPDSSKRTVSWISSDVLVGFLIFLGYALETIMLFCLTQKRKGLSRLLNGNSALFVKLLATVVLGDFDHTNDFATRLENCKLGLLKWSKSEFGHISKRIEFLEHEITSIQSSAIKRTSRERLSSLKAELESLLSAEEIKWKQRGKATWLSEGDRNTAFFHAKASHWRKINHINRIRDETGCWCDEPASIQGVIQRYFHTIFTFARPTREELNEVIETIPTRVTSEMNRKLLEDYSAKETIANRLKPLLDHIISPSQSAFVPGRLITDNVLVAFELNHSLKNKRRGKEGYVAVKLDMGKAYDGIKWVFLENMLSKLGFHNRVGSLIMLCVRSVTYSFILNGTQFGFVKPERGIRQGDPLSPYLFILCAEGFSCLLQAKEHNGDIRGVAVARRAPKVSHLLFADDTLIFCQATKEAMRCIRGILEKYERASGQLINLDKSSIFFSNNTTHEDRMEMATLLGVRIDSMPAKYLGLPYFFGRNKEELFSYVRTRVWQRVSGWKEKMLSQAGNEILIKSIVQSIPSYCMSCFKLPDSLLREIESIAANFFWSNTERNKIHWVAWDKMCMSKKEGGLGFRKMQTFNVAMLAKQGWHIMSNPDLLISRILKARYYRDNDFLHAKIGYNPSFAWRSILAARYIISKGIRWRVGDGQSIRVWSDP
ncbi:UNVERIFIED_CONTAM: putative mitochondrial protein [Sesamum radiatum]|uniref:Mitochondrial protein n=1 Tax=Sesamum radiatum TaxID=300843 RepID=A0AAW2V269_SESRA